MAAADEAKATEAAMDMARSAILSHVLLVLSLLVLILLLLILLMLILLVLDVYLLGSFSNKICIIEVVVDIVRSAILAYVFLVLNEGYLGEKQSSVYTARVWPDHA